MAASTLYYPQKSSYWDQVNQRTALGQPIPSAALRSAAEGERFGELSAYYNQYQSNRAENRMQSAQDFYQNTAYPQDYALRQQAQQGQETAAKYNTLGSATTLAAITSPQWYPALSKMWSGGQTVQQGIDAYQAEGVSALPGKSGILPNQGYGDTGIYTPTPAAYDPNGPYFQGYAGGPETMYAGGQVGAVTEGAGFAMDEGVTLGTDLGMEAAESGATSWNPWLLAAQLAAKYGGGFLEHNFPEGTAAYEAGSFAADAAAVRGEVVTDMVSAIGDFGSDI